MNNLHMEYEVKSIKTIRVEDGKGEKEHNIIKLESQYSEITIKLLAEVRHGFVIGEEYMITSETEQTKLQGAV